MSKRKAEEESLQLDSCKRSLSDTCTTTLDKHNDGFEVEKRVGIDVFLNDTVGFHAIVKSRFSDFVVNEISLDGEQAMMIPIDEQEQSEQPIDNECAEKVENVEIDWSPVEELIPSGVREAILAILDDEKLTATVPNICDKSDRTKVHSFIKTTFSKLTSCTDTGTNSIVVKSCKQDARSKSFRPRDPIPKHVRFVMQKVNRDTQDAINTIAKQLRLNTKLFTVAGTKDKRGITTQFVTASKIPISKLKAVSSRLRNIAISQFQEYPTALRLGDLYGNRFTLALRDLQCDNEESVRIGLEELKNNGFMNYYGMQRFGIGQFGTHMVGKAILQSKYKEACDMVLAARSTEEPNENTPASSSASGNNFDCNEARLEWSKTADAEKCLKLFPNRMIAERSILSALSTEKENWANALMRIPRNLRLMYVHAYQSYIWNRMASERVKMGKKPMVGDLVIDTTDKSKKTVRVLKTQEECEELNGDLSQIVLPLPGHSIVYPEGIIGERYKELLKEDGLDCKMAHPMKDFSLPGDYRAIVAKCHDMDFYFTKYDDNEEDLIGAKGEKIEKKKEGKYLGLVVSFKLECSSYATMAMRELLRIPTSSAYQSKLSLNN